MGMAGTAASVAGTAGASAIGVRAEDMSARRRWTAFGFLMLAEFFYGWSWNTVDALRPQIRESLGLTLTEAGSMYTAQSMGALVGAIVLAQLADRFGRRSTLFFVILGYGIFGVAGVFVTSYAQLLAQRFLLGFFLGAIFPVLIATYMGLFADTIRGKLSALGQGTYNLSVILLGQAYRLYGGGDAWETLLWAGAMPALVLAPLVFAFVPDDRRYRPWGAVETDAAVAGLPIIQLFRPPLLRLTGLLFLVTGCNFFAYQAFAGWVTTFLKDVKGYNADIAGDIFSWQFGGAVAGAFFWGWFSDRWGRRPAAIGFFVAAIAVVLYLGVLETPMQLRLAGAAWGFGITSSVAWAPWMTVLFPVALRSTAMSIFNWGRLISMTAPLVTGQVAESFGLVAAMALSAVVFAAGGAIWLLIPERLETKAA